MNRKWGLIWVAVMACIVAVLGGTGEVSAQTSADGQYEYELDQVTGNATLTKYLVDISSETEVVVPQQIDGHPVTALAGTYQGRDKITKVTIPAGVTAIDGTAFLQCSSIRAFDVAPDNTAYMQDAEGVLLSKDQTTLVRYPVGLHRNPATYTIPATVTALAPYSFSGYNTSDIVFGAQLRTIGDYAFAYAGNFNTVSSWEEGTVSIGAYAFAQCTNLNVTLPASVSSFGSYAFTKCTNIQIDISKCTAAQIAPYMFYQCDNMHNLTLSPSVVSVGEYAFSECTNLNEVVLSPNLTTLHKGAFANCRNLHIEEIPAGITVIEEDTFLNCQNLNVVALPEGLTTIEAGAFAGCVNIHEINIPDSVTYVAPDSFRDVDLSKVAVHAKVGTVKLKKAKKKGKRVVLSWKKVSNADGYVIYRSVKKGKGYRKIGTVTKGSVKSFADRKAKAGKTNYYKVRAYRVVAGVKCYGRYSNIKKCKR